MKEQILVALTLVTLMLINAVHAEENMRFHGILIKNPNCRINDDKPIEINFNNMGANDIDGIKHSRNIIYTISCDGNSDKHLYLSVEGKNVPWDDAAIKTSKNNLGIEIKLNGEPFKLGRKLSIDRNELPPLTAIPVKNNNQTLTTGDFTASATLVAFYQ